MTNIYAFYDKTAGSMKVLTTAPNDGLAIRENTPYLQRICPLGDIEIRKIGTINEETCRVETFEDYKIVDWNSYKFPESPLKNEKEEK